MKIASQFAFVSHILVVSILLLPFSVAAGDLQDPAGRVLLTVSGNIENTNSGGKALFDKTMLEAFGNS